MDIRMREQNLTRISLDTNTPATAHYQQSKAADAGSYSNLVNRLAWNPLPWLSVAIDSQLPVLDQGFTELNSSTSIQTSRDMTFTLGNRFVSGNPFFNDSNLVTGGARYRLSDNWSLSFEQNYEFETRQMEFQRYSVDRDLRSWMASLSVVVRERSPKNDMAVLLTLILKDVPKFRLPLHVDPEAVAGSGSSSRNKN